MKERGGIPSGSYLYKHFEGCLERGQQLSWTDEMEGIQTLVWLTKVVNTLLPSPWKVNA